MRPPHLWLGSELVWSWRRAIRRHEHDKLTGVCKWTESLLPRKWPFPVATYTLVRWCKWPEHRALSVGFLSPDMASPVTWEISAECFLSSCVCKACCHSPGLLCKAAHRVRIRHLLLLLSILPAFINLWNVCPHLQGLSGKVSLDMIRSNSQQIGFFWRKKNYSAAS